MSKKSDHSQRRRSSFSCGNGACVEIVVESGAVHIRDSKDPDGPWLTLSRSRWTAFVREMKADGYGMTEPHGRQVR